MVPMTPTVEVIESENTAPVALSSVAAANED